MGNILAKIGHFFEIHVEKIVLVVFGVLSLYVLMIRVIFSPNVVEFDNQKFSPNRIDQHIKQKYADPVSEAIRGPALSQDQYEPRLTGAIEPNDPVIAELKGTFDKGYEGLMANALAHIDDTLYPPQPRHSAADSTERRKYKLPFIGEVKEVKAGYIRAAAYFPVEDITEESTYDDVEQEPNDLDLITVEGKFKIGVLRQRFFESFASEDLPVEWRDKSMAEPVCAAVNLQRQELLADGRWGPWLDVPRLGIDHQPELMRSATKVDELPTGGVRVRMLQLNKYDVRQDLLQPLPFEIATTYEEWFPPTLHEEYLKLRDQERKEERREQREAELDQDRDTRGGRSRTGTRTTTGTRGGGAAGLDPYGGMGGGAGTQQDRRTRSTRGGRTVRGAADQQLPGATGPRTRGARGRGRQQGGAVDPLYGAGPLDAYGMGPGGMGLQNLGVNQMIPKFREVQLTFDKDFSKLDDFLFWAHDATVKPSKTYRYRIRLGVLNPAAGINDNAEPRNNDVILWSEFSSLTDLIYVPSRDYFFAKDYKEVAGGVSVEVMKFYQGYWRSEDFLVKPGETVGRVVEIKKEENTDTFVDPSMAMYGMPMDPMMQRQVPETVDYRTGAVFVDAVLVDGWTGGKRLRPQSHYSMLYSLDDAEIHRMAVGRPNWPESLVLAYNRAKQFQKEEIEDFRDFGSSLVRSGRAGLGGRGGMGMDLYGDMPRMNPGR